MMVDWVLFFVIPIVFLIGRYFYLHGQRVVSWILSIIVGVGLLASLIVRGEGSLPVTIGILIGCLGVIYYDKIHQSRSFPPKQ